MTQQSGNDAANQIAAMFGFVPADTQASDTQATLQYGKTKVVVEPGEYVNASQAFAENADDLGLDSTAFVNYSRDGNVIAGSQPVRAGDYLIATTKHDDKGGIS